MGNIETIYELRHLAPIMVAAPTELPADGMPYDENLPFLFAPTADLEGAARNTFAWYDSRSKDCQMAVYDTSALPALAEASRAIYSRVTGYPSSAQIASLQSYNSPRTSTLYTYDMTDVLEMLSAGMYPSLMAEWSRALSDVVTYAATTQYELNGTLMNHYCGLGSYAFRNANDIQYRNYNLTAWWNDVVSASPAYVSEP